MTARARPSLLESPLFPFERLSAIAEAESWRKEIHRPLSHVHKWWAQRLGTVFRAILLASTADAEDDLLALFYSPARLPENLVVFDPFMGSGTTLFEALKLGARAVGRDVNPVAAFAVRTALTLPPRERLERAFLAIEGDVADAIRHAYRAKLPTGAETTALYYFWVKELDCPACSGAVPLFSSYVFARHAYPARFPDARALCPACGAVHTLRFDATRTTCPACRHDHDPRVGPARGGTAECPRCHEKLPIAKTARSAQGPPRERLYAKMVLGASGEKLYLRSDELDERVYRESVAALETRPGSFPCVAIAPGANTSQMLSWGYTHFHQMFNARQLLCLGLLAERIRAIEDPAERDVFACLFSGALEFNNTFASFKGEGTGAVRHLFSHHVFKPERTPLEANVWGTPRSSGAFSTLFESRILRAVVHAEDPAEVRVAAGRGRGASAKVHGLSEPLAGVRLGDSFADLENGARVRVSCGDSSTTDLPPASVDLVVTDPPFFDNVHYSELADFFHVWLRDVLPEPSPSTTRSPREVQHGDPSVFAERLRAVWRECHRVLRDEGLLVFTYQHARAEGWRCVLDSLVRAGFRVVAAHPIKAEMAGATPKSGAKEPIDIDVILVCRKRTEELEQPVAAPLDEAIDRAREQIGRLRASRRTLGRGDVRVILSAQVVAALSRSCAPERAGDDFRAIEPEIERGASALWDGCDGCDGCDG